MKVSNWGGNDGLNVDGVYAKIGEFEWVTVELPSGHRVDVFADAIRVADPGKPLHDDGKKIWEPKS